MRRAPQASAGRSRGDLIEGRRAVDEALELGIPVSRALVQKDAGGDASFSELAARLEAAGIEVERVARPILDSLSSHGAHQGVMLRVRPYRYADITDVVERAGEGPALVIVLDHVTDEGNFGAIVRTAEVVGAAGVVIAKARAAGVGVGAYKTSAGAVMHLPIAQVSNLATAIDELKAHGFWAGGATEHAHDVIWDAPLSGRVALVMGSEGSGISRLVRQKCDFEFKLPQRGMVESLNVAQATTAIAYEWLRRDYQGGTAGGEASLGFEAGRG
nr:23S rRNA (guanosine(2251)-2'-O)-methyltransferase RlmB [uncultured Parolsenella sp.]